LADHGITESTQPIQAIRETIEVVRYLLSGATGGYHGEIYQLADHVKAPYPLPAEMPPILIGSWGRKLCALAGEVADEVKIGGSANPNIVPVMAGYVAEGERKVSRPVGSVGVCVGAVTVANEDRSAARWAARRSVALYLPVVAPLDPTLTVEPELVDRLREHVNRDELDDAARSISDDLLDKFAFSGNADDLIRQAEALFAAGASRVEFGTPHGLASPENGIRIIGEKVIPNIKQR
jgi:5,10-methylenetetrahydromethanopterin reductase